MSKLSPTNFFSPSYPNNKLSGLKSSFVNRKLLDLSKDFIVKQNLLQPSLINIYSNQLYTYTEIWPLLIIPVLFAISFSLTNAYEDLFSTLFTTLLFAFVLSARVFRIYRENNEVLAILSNKIDYFNNNKNSYSSLVDARFRLPCSDQSIRCIRDNLWVALPLTVIVADDVIALPISSVTPCDLLPHSKNIRSPILKGNSILHLQFEEVDTVNLSGIEYYIFTVVDEPLLIYLKNLLSNMLKNRPKSLFAVYREILKYHFNLIYYFCVSISFILTLVRLILSNFIKTNPSSTVWAYEILKRQASLMLCGSFFADSILSLILDILSHALLYTIIELVQNSLVDNSNSTLNEDSTELDELLDDNFDEESWGSVKSYSDSPSYTLIRQINLNFYLLYHNFIDIFTNNSKYRTFSFLPVHSFGSTNYMCFTDKTGVLTSCDLTPEHILLWKDGHHPTIIESINTSSNNDSSVDVTKNIYSNDKKIEKVQRSLDRDGITYALEGDWHDNLHALKPLGLATLLTSNCYCGLNSAQSQWEEATSAINNVDVSSSHNQKYYNRPILPASTEFKKKKKDLNLSLAQNINLCPCSISKTMGFDIPATISKYTIKKRINYNYLAKFSNIEFSEFSSESCVVQTNAGNIFSKKSNTSYQIFSKGSDRLILAKCLHYFDGENSAIKPFTIADKTKFFQIINHWHQEDLLCVAYSYSPVLSNKSLRLLHADPENDHIFLNNSTPDIVSPVLPEKKRTSVMSVLRSKSGDFSNHANAFGMPIQPRHNSSFINSINSPMSTYVHSTAHAALMAQYNNFLTKHIFLGLVAYRDQAKHELPSFVEDILQAGIRFAMLLPEKAFKMKAFAEKIGLDTDWNSCISLQDPDDKHRVLSPDENRSKLPQGVSTVRDHLLNIDDVPLLISLFSDCKPDTSKEMVKILQENGGVVCVVGSSLSYNHCDIFQTSDSSIVIDPLPTKECCILKEKKSSKSELSVSQSSYSLCFEYSFASSLHSLSSFGPNLLSNTKLHQISAIIAQSRVIYKSYKQAVLFAWSSYVTLLLLICLLNCAASPMIFNNYQIIWLSFYIIPLFSISLIFGKYSGHEMKQMPDKNEDHLIDKYVFIGYYCLRFIPSLVVLMIIFVSTINSIYDYSKILNLYYWNYLGYDSFQSSIIEIYDSSMVASLSPNDCLLDSTWYLSSLIVAQNWTMIFFVWFLCFLSLGFAQRNRSIFHYNPLKNLLWVVAVFLGFSSQIIFSVVSLITLPKLEYLNLFPPNFVLIVSLLWPIVIIIIDEFVKSYDSKKFAYYQRRLKLTFDTKLGVFTLLKDFFYIRCIVQSKFVFLCHCLFCNYLLFYTTLLFIFYLFIILHTFVILLIKCPSYQTI